MKKIIIILGIIIIIASACTQGNVNKQATLTIADNFDSTVVVCTDSIDEQIIINGSDTKAIIEDFNNDGFRDTLTSFYDGGSGFGGNYIVLISGKTKERFELDDYGCFCDIKQIVLIPPELRKTSNKLFLETIKKELLPKKMNLPDASLQWLITANMNSKRLS
ncbi:hypothetical protein LJC30_06910, partial [Odoribacter sp. OttesenSCG-928-L07]|nr:hypothetical protein [Odoribacter sp. OttesenSCG-928-L07]